MDDTEQRVKAEMNNPTRLITVCSACMRASCWHGIEYCADYQTAGTVDFTRAQLDHMNREHPSNYSDEKLMEVTGA